MDNYYIVMPIERGSTLVIQDPCRRDMQELAFTMREADRKEIIRSTGGMVVPHIIEMALELSVYSRVGLIDGRVAAMWGLVVPKLLGSVGHPWAMTTPVVERYPRTFLRCSRFYVEEMLRIVSRLSVNIDEEYCQALSWLRRLGFNVDDQILIEDCPFRLARLEVA